jgi:hypothetical protein
MLIFYTQRDPFQEDKNSPIRGIFKIFGHKTGRSGKNAQNIGKMPFLK